RAPSPPFLLPFRADYLSAPISRVPDISNRLFGAEFHESGGGIHPNCTSARKNLPARREQDRFYRIDKGVKTGGPNRQIPFRLPSFGGGTMSAILTDLLVFSCLAAFITGIIIAAATQLMDFCGRLTRLTPLRGAG